jgi:hypothetical protein
MRRVLDEQDAIAIIDRANFEMRTQSGDCATLLEALRCATRAEHVDAAKESADYAAIVEVVERIGMELARRAGSQHWSLEEFDQQAMYAQRHYLLAAVRGELMRSQNMALTMAEDAAIREAMTKAALTMPDDHAKLVAELRVMAAAWRARATHAHPDVDTHEQIAGELERLVTKYGG